MKIALITSFPPSRGDLNEYGYHLACALRDNKDVQLVILADDLKGGEEMSGFVVHRCWRFNSFLSPFRILRTMQQVKPDVVWFNMGFSTFASSALIAFLSVMTPLVARAMGFQTHVTLHTIFERISLVDAQVRPVVLYRTAGRLATRLLLWSGDISVLLPSFRSELLRSYGAHADRIHYHRHGSFRSTDPASGYEPNRSDHTILVFGYWGTYKKLDLLLDSMDEIVTSVPDAVLSIAGQNHPSAAGYLESLQERWRGNPAVRFLGYVAEADLADLFNSSRLLVLPYSSAAGTSGVVHQACQYGLPLVAAAIPEFLEMAQEQSVAMRFYAQSDGQALTSHVIQLLKSDDLCRTLSEQNLAAARATPMSEVVNDYLQLFHKRALSSKIKGKLC